MRKRAAPTRIKYVPIEDLEPTPENDFLYRPIDRNDPDLIALSESIAKHGVREPLVISRDGFIVSGHRRRAAAIMAGLRTVPVRVEDIDSFDDRFLALIREHNRQRVKTAAELWREEVVNMSTGSAYAALLTAREKKADLSVNCVAASVEPGKGRARCRISEAKQPMLSAVLAVIREREAYWPLSDRSIHYALLNDPPLRHAKKPESRYRNDRASYCDLTDLLTRARLAGRIGWDAIGDETRPVTLWCCDDSVQPFVRRELAGFLASYWRNAQQSQPNHVELVAEKLTVKPIVEPVAQDYCLPLTIGRGYCSINPRREIAERFRKSGRERLVLIMLSDHDPDGETIATSFVRSIRDDFGIKNVEARKAAITREQVEEFQLPPVMKAKQGSATYAAFAEKHGDDVYEMEALRPEDLQRVLRTTIESVLDMGAFEAERQREQDDARFLVGVRSHARRILADVVGEGGAA